MPRPVKPVVYVVVRGERGEGVTVKGLRSRLRAAKALRAKLCDQTFTKLTVPFADELERGHRIIEEWECPEGVDFVRIERWLVR